MVPLSPKWIEPVTVFAYVMGMKFSRFRLGSLSQRLSAADIVFYLMPAIMAVLVAGTLAQADLGLYAAQKKYFSSFVFFWGVVPLPGGFLLLSALSACLVLKFVFHSEWSLRKSGIILAHLGALVLLLGGLFTALSAREGYMVIPEGGDSPFVYDYHARELLVFRNDQLAHTVPFERIEAALSRPADLPLGIVVRNSCANCEIKKRAEFEQDFAENTDLQSFAQFMALTPKPPDKNAEANLSGFSFTMRGLGEGQDGLYIAFEAMPKPIEVTQGGANYKLIFGKAQRRLPFSIRLLDFEKQNYPGMTMAKGYSSAVEILDGTGQWHALISMNAPLRYKGYTFYQSSFDQGAAGETTVLSVVENKGRLFPYIGTFIIALGLLLHVLIAFRGRAKKEAAA